jgi:uncharacterized RDD family membrane protein YckC
MASSATAGTAVGSDTLEVVDVSGLARGYRLVTIGMYFMMILSVLKIPKLIQAALSEPPQVGSLIGLAVWLCVYGFCLWVGWENLNIVGAVSHPHVVPALAVMAGSSLLTVATLAKDKGIEGIILATFDVLALVACVGAMIAILFLRGRPVPGLPMTMGDFLDHGFFRVTGPKLPPSNRNRAIGYLVLGFAWFLALDFVPLEFLSSHSLLEPYTLAEAAGFLFLVQARRNLEPDFKTLIKGDPRPPVLFLRSFQDDQNVTEGSRSESVFKNLGFIGYGFFDFSLESRLAKHFSGFGPFIAIGSPNDTAAHLGAIRVQLSDDEWQGSVVKWIGESRVVLIMAGASQWVHWELQTLIRSNQMGKTVLVFPQVQKRARSTIKSPEERLDSLRRAFEETDWARALADLSVRYEAKNIRAIIFRRDGKVTAVISKPKSRDSFNLAALISHYLLEHDAAKMAGVSVAVPESHRDKLARLSTRGMAALLDGALIFALYAVLQTYFTRTVSTAEACGVIAVLGFVYYWMFEWLMEATPGKIVFRAHILRESGDRPGCRASAVRNLLRFVDALGFYLVGYIFARKSESWQRLGDRAAGTVVGKGTPRGWMRGGWMRGGWMRALMAVGCGALLFLGYTRDLGGPHVGSVDKVYYTGPASQMKAKAVAKVFTDAGFFSGKGIGVHLSEGKSGEILTFQLVDGFWDKPEAVIFYEWLGLVTAPRIGGYPIVIRLADALGKTRKELVVGRQPVGKDEVYFLGAATEADAKSLGAALQKAGFFRGSGFSVLLSKNGGTALGFAVQDGIWDKAESVADFESITRQVAPSVGGTPITLRFLDAQLVEHKEEVVR